MHIHELEAQIAKAGDDHAKAAKLEKEVEELEHKWKDSINWASIGWTKKDLQKPGARASTRLSHRPPGVDHVPDGDVHRHA